MREAWTYLTVRDGEKGPVAIEMVKRRVQTRIERKRTGPDEWLVVTRRPLADDRTLEPRASRDATDQDARYRYQYYLTPTDGSEVAFKEPSLGELGRVIKAGACIEASFKRGKGEVGMDEYQVRTWQGWHHHMALSLMAVWFLIGETHRGQQVTPALTLPQVRYGLSLLLLEVFSTPGVDSIAVKSSVNYCATSRRDSTIIAPVSAYHSGSYIERYSRFMPMTISPDETGEAFCSLSGTELAVEEDTDTCTRVYHRALRWRGELLTWSVSLHASFCSLLSLSLFSQGYPDERWQRRTHGDEFTGSHWHCRCVCCAHTNWGES